MIFHSPVCALVSVNVYNWVYTEVEELWVALYKSWSYHKKNNSTMKTNILVSYLLKLKNHVLIFLYVLKYQVLSTCSENSHQSHLYLKIK